MDAKLHWESPGTDQAIEVLSRDGFDAVEWMLGYHFNTPKDLKVLVEKTRKAGLEISNIMCWQDLVRT